MPLPPIALNGFYAAKHYPAYLRRIRYRDPATGKNLVFLTNQFALPALTMCALYRCRWQVELFFKWIKQHLRIKRFYGTSENAVRTQTEAGRFATPTSSALPSRSILMTWVSAIVGQTRIQRCRVPIMSSRLSLIR
jgi:Transposase DDE domain